jgi:TldD protein
MMMTENLEKYQNLLGDYTELRAQENRSFVLGLLNGKMTTNSSSSESGVSARHFHNGSWGFSSHPQQTAASIANVVKEARSNAQFLGKKTTKTAHGHLATVSAAKARIDLATKKAKWTSEELISRLREFDSYLAKTYPDVTNRTFRCFQQDFIKDGINSVGATTYSHYVRSYVVASLGMNSEHGPVDVKFVLGDKGELEDTFPAFEVFKVKANEAYTHLRNKMKGVFAEGGTKEVILSSKVAGILAHEAIGHTVEADLVMGGSVAGSFLNQQVASPLVTLVDFAHTALGKQAPMPVLFDDEGTEAEDTVLIENGILKGYMNSKESAHHFGQKATGHARAWGFNDEPLIRMRNTAIMPGKDKLEDMIASVDDGYYLLDHSNGQADSTSEFMFGVVLGYEIKKGKIGRAILDTTIAGIAFDMLKTVSMVSDEMTWVSYGTCGKKQPMTVGMGGPAVKCKINIGGR